LKLNPIINQKEKLKEHYNMIKHYPYRFKTKEEFVKEFGLDWRRKASLNSYGHMDYLLETPYPFIVNNGDKLLNITNTGYNNYQDYWSIGWQMLTPNIKIKPNYKPKGKIERTL
jgi:hypothetical protein